MACVSGEKGCYAFLWKIENFEYFGPKSTLSLFSPSFKTHWKLELHLRTIGDYVRLRLRNEEAQEQEGKVDCEVSLLTADDTVVRKLTIFGAVVAEWTNKTCVDFIPMSKIFESRGLQFPQKHALTVLCKIWQQGMQSGQHMARTVFHNETFIWNIKKFSNGQKTATNKFRLASRCFTINLSKSGSF